jgi:hypothetical protein
MEDQGYNGLMVMVIVVIEKGVSRKLSRVGPGGDAVCITFHGPGSLCFCFHSAHD